MKRKLVKEIEVIEVYELESPKGWGNVLGRVMIVPDLSIHDGYKKTCADRIFISPRNYNDIRSLTAERIINALSLLTEVKGKVE